MNDRRGLYPALLLTAMVVAAGSSLGAPLITTIAHTDHVRVGVAQWSLTLCFLVGAAITPVLGRLSNPGLLKPLIVGTLAVVLLGDLISAAPLGITTVLIGRALQGTGLALVPLTIAAAHQHLTPTRAPRAAATLSVTVAVGVGIGYPVFGVIAAFAGPTGAFLAAAVFATCSLLAILRTLPGVHGAEWSSKPFDVAGSLLFAVAAGSFLLELSEAPQWGWGSPLSIAALTVTVLAAVAWVGRERRAPAPLVDVRALRQRAVLNANATCLLAGTAMYLVLSTTARLLEALHGQGFGWNTAAAGCALIPFALGTALGHTLAIRASRGPGLRAQRTLMGTAVAGCLGIVPLGFIHGSVFIVLTALLLTGIAVGNVFSSTPATLRQSLPAREAASIMSFNQTLRYLGYAIGSALSLTLPTLLPATSSENSDAAFQAVGVAVILCWLSVMALGTRRSSRGSDSPLSTN